MAAYSSIKLLMGALMLGGFVSAHEMANLKPIEGEGRPASVVYWCMDTNPWTYISDPGDTNCNETAATSEPLVTCDCPDCPAPAATCPQIKSINVTAGKPSKEYAELLQRDLANIEEFCKQAQKLMPLTRLGTKEFSAILKLQQLGWEQSNGKDTYMETKLSLSLAPFPYDDHNDQKKRTMCDITPKEDEKNPNDFVNSCVKRFKVLRALPRNVQGGYKAELYACKLYEWTPMWPKGKWPYDKTV